MIDVLILRFYHFQKIGVACSYTKDQIRMIQASGDTIAPNK